MRLKIGSFVLIFLISSSSLLAQVNNSMVNPNNIPNAVASAVNALIRVSVPKSVVKDTISGVCTYPKTGSCNGATISLKYKDTQVYSMTMTSTWEFKIPNLKPRENYLLSIEWKKHGLKKEVAVIPGEYVTIQLE